MKTVSDKYLKSLGLSVEILSVTPNPQTLVYAAMIQDYSESSPWESMYSPVKENYTPNCVGGIRDPKNPGRCLDEKTAGERVISNCMKFKHFGPLEHPQMVVNVLGYPHTVMQQYRTHRTGISFDCQSGRYTGQRIIKVANNELPVSKVFFIRPPGKYQDKGVSINWTEENYRDAEYDLYQQCVKYANAVVNTDMPKEMARDLYIPYGVRQNFVMSFNLRTGFHLADMRGKADAELEAQWLAQQIVTAMSGWAPDLVGWYVNNRLGKNLIAP